MDGALVGLRGARQADGLAAWCEPLVLLMRRTAGMNVLSLCQVGNSILFLPLLELVEVRPGARRS